jgi:hypothetical protein
LSFYPTVTENDLEAITAGALAGKAVSIWASAHQDRPPFGLSNLDRLAERADGAAGDGLCREDRCTPP